MEQHLEQDEGALVIVPSGLRLVCKGAGAGFFIFAEKREACGQFDFYACLQGCILGN